MQCSLETYAIEGVCLESGNRQRFPRCMDIVVCVELSQRSGGKKRERERDIKDSFQFANFRDGEMESQRSDFSNVL